MQNRTIFFEKTDCKIIYLLYYYDDGDSAWYIQILEIKLIN